MMVQAVLGSMTEDAKEQINEVKSHFNNLRQRMILIHEEGDMTQAIVTEDDLVEEVWW